jgi:quercetin dioxygenase-like cupin family protein
MQDPKIPPGSSPPTPQVRTDLTAQQKERHLAERCLSFQLDTELTALRRDAGVQQGGHSARTLVKHDDLRVVLISLSSGARLEEHTANARVSIQAVTGAVRLRVGDGVVELSAGGLLVLDRSVPHDVEAIEDSAILLTLAWPG